MAVLTSPCKIPFIIREDKSKQFIEKCKKSSLSEERRQELMEYSKRIRSESSVQNKREL